MRWMPLDSNVRKDRSKTSWPTGTDDKLGRGSCSCSGSLGYAHLSSLDLGSKYLNLTFRLDTTFEERVKSIFQTVRQKLKLRSASGVESP